MPKVKCEAFWCDKNKDNICTNDEIELSFEQYEQFWCQSAWQFGMKNNDFQKLSLREQREVVKKWQENFMK